MSTESNEKDDGKRGPFGVVVSLRQEGASSFRIIIDDVKCAADRGESYALYLPSTYSIDRKWNLLIAFHPGAPGRLMVEKYQAAAEQYGANSKNQQERGRLRNR